MEERCVNNVSDPVYVLLHVILYSVNIVKKF